MFPDTSKVQYRNLIELILDQLATKLRAEQVMLGVPSALPLPVGGRIKMLSSLWAFLPLEARIALDSRFGNRDIRSCTAGYNGVPNGTLVLCLPITDPVFETSRLSGDEFWGVTALVLLQRKKSFSEPETWAAEALARQLTIPLEHLYHTYHPHNRDSEIKALGLLKALADFNPLGQDEHTMLEKACRSLKEHLGAVRVVVAYPDDEGNLRPRVSAGLPVQRVEAAVLPAGKSISHIAMEERRLIYVPDTAKEPQFLPNEFGIPSLIVAPLLIEDKVLGTLSVDGAYPHAFSQSDVYLVQAVAAYLASAIENLRLYHSLSEQHEHLRRVERKRTEVMENISHELRTPLAIMKGHIEILLDDLEGKPEFAQFRHSLEVAYSKIQVMEHLTHDIIVSLAENERGFYPSKVELCSLVEMAAKNHELHAKRKGITIEVKKCAHPLTVWGDPAQLEEVCDNLINNALKYTYPNTKVTLSLKPMPNFVRCAISDEGPGIPEDQKEKVFERFYQVESAPTRKHGGLGLGLAIVKKIVENNHHGKIWVENNTPKPGVTFYVDLPYAK